MLRVSRRLYSQGGSLIRTPLYEAHIQLGGKMVDYAGFEMPVLYKGQTHIESHNWTREKVGLFDVSHMLQHRVSGKDAGKFLQKVTPLDTAELKPFTSSLSVLLNEQGGVIDDCIITKHGENEFYMVTNAGCRAKDLKFLGDEATKFSELSHKPFESTLLAIQGPKAHEILQKFTNEDLSKLYFGSSVFAKVSGIDDVHIARSGYTGEDGFELSIPNAPESLAFFNSMIADYPDLVKPIGLAARDSLRLEAGMCLYGHELSEETTPIEAGLTWLIPKTRREGATANFNGASKILDQIKSKNFSQRRIGVTSKGPSPRDGNKIFNDEGKQVGIMTSGSPSPTLGGNIGQAYIDKTVKIGFPIKIEIRGKLRDGQVAKLPFIQPKFYRGD
jgi:aminomethyltransferase